MVFVSPLWVPKSLPEIPDVSLWDFMLDDRYGRFPISKSLPSYTCGLTGKTIVATEQAKDAELLAKSLAHELELSVNAGAHLDKVICIYAQNTIDIMTLNLAIHRLNCVSAPISASFVAAELESQLAVLKPKALFCTPPLLENAIQAAKKCMMPLSRIFICEMPTSNWKSAKFKTLAQLIDTGKTLADLEAISWMPGQSKRQVAFICSSSGTSGLPKQVMISHHNISANVIQLTAYERKGRISPNRSEVVLGMLPHSHIYGVVVIAYLSFHRGDCIVSLPAFNMDTVLKCTERYGINTLNLVPTVISEMAKHPSRLSAYDLRSVRSIVSGGAALSKETVESMAKNFPNWAIRPAYGATEAAACISHTSSHDPVAGSGGSLLPGVQVKLLDPDGAEITRHNQPGELLAKSPSIVLGYLGNEEATRESFIEDASGRWLRTGDIVEIRLAPSGTEHLFIVDRVKDMIKVKGHQVAPAEVEACLLASPFVTDCAVIGVHDERSGEVPKAFIQKSATAAGKSDRWLSKSLQDLVGERLAKYKSLKGGVEFIESIPRSPSNKILKRQLRDRETVDAKQKLDSKL